jgi:hypothetical protein
VYNENGMVSVSMKSYLEESIQESGMLKFLKTAATPAKKDIFDITEESEVLENKEPEVFHSIVANLLYVATRARPDLLLAISFLCTHVSSPMQQDQQKLHRLLEYSRIDRGYIDYLNTSVVHWTCL